MARTNALTARQVFAKNRPRKKVTNQPSQTQQIQAQLNFKTRGINYKILSSSGTVQDIDPAISNKKVREKKIAEGCMKITDFFMFANSSSSRCQKMLTKDRNNNIGIDDIAIIKELPPIPERDHPVYEIED